MSFNIKYGLFKLNIIDHYAVLGIPVDAELKDIRLRYLKIVQGLHPDTYKTENEKDRLQANEILAKLVNPAYEQLYKDKSRGEYQIVLSQVGKRLALEDQKITISNDIVQKLYSAGSNLKNIYHQLIKQLASEQYKNIKEITYKIGAISEINLVYLTLTQGEINQLKPPAKTKSNAATNQESAKTNKSAKPQKEKVEMPEERVSPLTTYIRRAQDYIDKNDYTKAILELRDGLKIDPSNSTCHGLLGIAYLRQNQITMAKVHIMKAWQNNPKDPISVQSKQELEKILPDAFKTEDSKAKKQGGLFGNFFGKKK